MKKMSGQKKNKNKMLETRRKEEQLKEENKRQSKTDRITKLREGEAKKKNKT